MCCAVPLAFIQAVSRSVPCTVLHGRAVFLIVHSMCVLLCVFVAVVEPWLVPVGFAIRARALGVEIRTGRKVVDISPADDGGGVGKEMWGVRTQVTSRLEACSSGRSRQGGLLVERVGEGNTNCDSVADKDDDASTKSVVEEEIAAGVVINCAGKRHKVSVHETCCVSFPSFLMTYHVHCMCVSVLSNNAVALQDCLVMKSRECGCVRCKEAPLVPAGGRCSQLQHQSQSQSHCLRCPFRLRLGKANSLSSVPRHTSLLRPPLLPPTLLWPGKLLL